MAYYSISAQAQSPVAVPEALTVLDRGLNVFTVATEDIETILARLCSEGVLILTCNRLDDHERLPPNEAPLQLE